MHSLKQNIFVVQCNELGQITYQDIFRHFDQQFRGISISDNTFSKTGRAKILKKVKSELN